MHVNHHILNVLRHGRDANPTAHREGRENLLAHTPEPSESCDPTANTIVSSNVTHANLTANVITTKDNSTMDALMLITTAEPKCAMSDNRTSIHACMHAFSCGCQRRSTYLSRRWSPTPLALLRCSPLPVPPIVLGRLRIHFRAVPQTEPGLLPLYRFLPLSLPLLPVPLVRMTTVPHHSPQRRRNMQRPCRPSSACTRRSSRGRPCRSRTSCTWGPTPPSAWSTRPCAPRCVLG